MDIIVDTEFPGWESTAPQSVGAVGILLNGAAARTLKFTMDSIPDCGPDHKVFGGAPVPESALLLLLGAGLIGLAAAARRRQLYTRQKGRTRSPGTFRIFEMAS